MSVFRSKPEEISLFARPLSPPEAQPEIPRSGAFFGMGLFVLPFLLGGIMLFSPHRQEAQNIVKKARPTLATGEEKKAAKSAPAPKAVAETAKAQTPKEDGPSVEPSYRTDDGRYSAEFYTQGVRGTMFTPPQPPAPKPLPPVKKVEPPKPKPAPVVVEEPNPFQDWSYTGTVKQGSQMMALVENTKTKEGQYVRIGETLLGHQVTAITDQSIAFAQAGPAGKTRSLAKSDTMTMTPLTASAAYLAGGGQPGVPGQEGTPPPGGMPAMPQMNGSPGGLPGVVLSNGRALNAAQNARRVRGLNRRFNR